MGVDPNMPLRDSVFLQEVLIATLADAKKDVLSGAPSSLQEQAMPIRPAEGLKPIVDRYTQDSFALEIIHALSQRESGKRLRTMGLIVKDREHIKPETIERIRNKSSSLLADADARHFLDALEGKATWQPSPGSKHPLKRKGSLRSIVTKEVLVSAQPK